MIREIKLVKNIAWPTKSLWIQLNKYFSCGNKRKCTFGRELK